MVNAINGFSDIDEKFIGVRERGNHVRNGKGHIGRRSSPPGEEESHPQSQAGASIEDKEQADGDWHSGFVASHLRRCPHGRESGRRIQRHSQDFKYRSGKLPKALKPEQLGGSLVSRPLFPQLRDGLHHRYVAQSSFHVVAVM